MFDYSLFITLNTLLSLPLLTVTCQHQPILLRQNGSKYGEDGITLILISLSLTPDLLFHHHMLPPCRRRRRQLIITIVGLRRRLRWTVPHVSRLTICPHIITIRSLPAAGPVIQLRIGGPRRGRRPYTVIITRRIHVWHGRWHTVSRQTSSSEIVI